MFTASVAAELNGAHRHQHEQSCCRRRPGNDGSTTAYFIDWRSHAVGYAAGVCANSGVCATHNCRDGGGR